jgi:hypothetical protein
VCLAVIFWLGSQYERFFIFGRADGNVFGLFSIYQVWVYWPTMLAFMFCALSISGAHHYIFKIILLLGIIFTGAREPLLFILFFMIIQALLDRNFFVIFRVVFFLSCTFVLTFFVFSLYPDLVISKKIYFMLSGQQALDAGRFEVIKKFDFKTLNFLFGTGFNDDAFFGSAHNQYLELYYRGGLISLIPIIFIIFIIFSKKSISTFLIALFASVFCVSFNINVPLRSPYFATFFWFFIFLIVDLKLHRRQIHETNLARHGSRHHYYHRSPCPTGN